MAPKRPQSDSGPDQTITMTVTDRLDRDLVAYAPGDLIELSPEDADSLQKLGVVAFAESPQPVVPAG